jgi:hypothetical protein
MKVKVTIPRWRMFLEWEGDKLIRTDVCENCGYWVNTRGEDSDGETGDYWQLWWKHTESTCQTQPLLLDSNFNMIRPKGRITR